MEVGLDGGDQELEDVPGLLTAGLDGGEQGFHEAAAAVALRAEAELAPNHRVPKRTLAGVVGRLNAF